MDLNFKFVCSPVSSIRSSSISEYIIHIYLSMLICMVLGFEPNTQSMLVS